MPGTGRLEGKRAFVTAAGQGIGQAIALAFAAEGAEVFASDIDEAKVAAIATATLRTRKLDVLDAAAIAAACREAGEVDILFNCAGFVHQGTVLETTDEAFTLAFDLNVRSMFRTIRALLPGMVARKRGTIVNIASVASTVKGIPNRAVYGSSKAAVIGLTKSVAADFVRDGVRCNCICPGTVESPSLRDRMAENAGPGGSLETVRASYVARQAMGRLGTPEEIAKLAVYLASDEAEFITGQAIVIDGGITI